MVCDKYLYLYEVITNDTKALAYCSSIIFPGINLPNVSLLSRFVS